MDADNGADLQVVRFHTEGRRQPTLIGKDASGHKLWGGPYTVYQALGVIAGIPIFCTGLRWAGFPLLASTLGGLTLTGVLVWLLGYLSITKNPAYALAGAFNATWAAISAPHGKLNGRPVPIQRKPVRHPATTRIDHVQDNTVVRGPTPTEQPHPTPPDTPNTIHPQAPPIPCEPTHPAHNQADNQDFGQVRMSALESFLHASATLRTDENP